ncbi:MAG: hypothetical protein ACM3NS_07590 [Deltaproteobacteria bacterium]
MTDPSSPPPTPPPGSPTGADAPPPGAPPRARTKWLPILLGAGLIAGLAAAATVLRRPTLVFTNALMAPVHLSVNDAPQLVAPGATVRIRVGRGMLVAQWELERPLSATREPMGEIVRGSWVIPSPRGTMTRAADPRTDTGDYFAPLVTNQSSRLLRITVNAGLEGARDCGCMVRPGAERVFLGYYRLYQNSTVRATDPRGGAATFRDLGPEARSRGWTVGLRFTDGNFPR